MSPTSCLTLSSAKASPKTRFSVLVCAVALAFGLSACSYKLAGQGEQQGRKFSSVLKQVTLQNIKRYDPLRAIIVDRLRLYGIRTVASGTALPRIIVAEQRLTERRAVVGDFARTRETLLSLHFEFSVIHRGKVLLEPQSIQLQETYLYNINEPNRNRNERAVTLRRLHQSLAERIINRLATIGQQDRKPRKGHKGRKPRKEKKL